MGTEETTKEKKQKSGEEMSKIDLVEIKRAIFETAKDLKHADKDIEKIDHDKEELLADLAELRAYEKGEKDGRVSIANGKLIGRSIRAIQKRMQKMSGALPDFELGDVQKKLHKIITEWKEGKNELRGAKAAHMQAEHCLTKTPADHKALGDANRAEAIIYDTGLKLDRIAGEAILFESNMEPSPVISESVNIHTGEEEIAKSQKSKVKSEEEQSQSVFAESEEKKEATSPVLDFAQEEGISYTREQANADEKERARILAERDPVRNEWVHYTHEQALVDEKMLETTHKISAESILATTLSELAQGGIHTQEIREESAPRESFAPETQEKTIVFEEANAHMVELPEPEEHLLLEDSETIAKEHKKIEEQKVPPSYADTVFSDHLNKLFGRKGFFGFGAKDGIVSPHWADPVVGFASKTVDEILEAGEYPLADEEISGGVGIENKQETTKMKDYLSQAMEQTGVASLAGERVDEYVRRAIVTAVGK